jgi:hypothetical protein
MVIRREFFGLPRRLFLAKAPPNRFAQGIFVGKCSLETNFYEPKGASGPGT